MILCILPKLEWFKINNLDVLKWMCQNPDLSLIENLWQKFYQEEWTKISHSDVQSEVHIQICAYSCRYNRRWFYQLLFQGVNTYVTNKCLLFFLINLCVQKKNRCYLQIWEVKEYANKEVFSKRKPVASPLTGYMTVL